MCWKRGFSRMCFWEGRLNLLWLYISSELQTNPSWAQMIHVLALGLGRSLQFGVSFDVCCSWISWERMGLVPALCDGEVWRVQQGAELDGHWEGLAGRKLGLIKTSKEWRLQRKCREQPLAESLLGGPCHLGEDRQPGWALLWGVDHSYHSQWEWKRPQGRTSTAPPGSFADVPKFRLFGRAGRWELHLFLSPFCVPTLEMLVAVY